MNPLQRRNIGMLGSLAIHILVFLLIAFTGLLGVTVKNNSDIAEIAIYDGGGGGGGGGGQGGDDGGDIEESAEEDSDTTEDVQEPQQPQDAIYSQQPNTPAPTQAAKPKAPKKTSKGGSGGGTGGGHGTGHGTGTGSGTGPGSGSGSGGGSGSGHGTGIGSGYGSGISSNPAVPPRIVRSVMPQYPAAQRNAGIEGVTIVRFLIGYDGQLEDVSVIQSSGNAALDNAAVSACRQWRFTGARNSSGQKVRCYSSMPITFKLR